MAKRKSKGINKGGIAAIAAGAGRTKKQKRAGAATAITGIKSGASSNLAQAAKLKAQANSINAKYGRNRFQVGAGMLNQAVAPGGLTKAGKVSKAQVKAARQTAKNILGSSES